MCWCCASSMVTVGGGAALLRSPYVTKGRAALRPNPQCTAGPHPSATPTPPHERPASFARCTGLAPLGRRPSIRLLSSYQVSLL
ncbi:Hypothetical protein NTJ_03995 [Nesidiocoris tenuis]|uniref:Secreted protein n=1 Tax=Nesidiocoris tenuis TaxID=355587 RepID=A0ABN7AIT2_9HEMI|nr:Hypothetical protein NTJ_03995 [Nesidiocoris tenuis]